MVAASPQPSTSNPHRAVVNRKFTAACLDPHAISTSTVVLPPLAPPATAPVGGAAPPAWQVSTSAMMPSTFGSFAATASSAGISTAVLATSSSDCAAIKYRLVLPSDRNP